MKPRTIWRRAFLFLAGLAACALIVAGIDVARHFLAIRRIDKTAGLSDWHYRLSGRPAPSRYPDSPAESWRGFSQRLIASPRTAYFLTIVYSSDRHLEVGPSTMRDLTTLQVEEAWFLDCRGLTPAAMAELSGNHSLHTLKIDSCDLTNEELDLLWSRLPNLESVHLHGFTIGDQGFQNVKGARHLKYLALEDTGITTETIARLRDAPSLEKLFLSGVNLTEDYAAPLATLPGLRSLEVNGLSVGASIRERLRTLNPTIEVTVRQ
jgi:hypothetical protein